MNDPIAVRLSTCAMATRFELLLYGNDPVRLRAAAEEAIGEIERLDVQLSKFRPESDISHINARASIGPVRVEPGLFGLLRLALEIWEKTEGALDVTIGPLMRAWGLAGGEGRVPSDDELRTARRVVGMDHVHLDADNRTVSFSIPGIEIDLGAIGKGYAIERAAESLRENGVTCGLIHGGTSTVYGIGSQPSGEPWKVAVRVPGRSGEWRVEGEGKGDPTVRPDLQSGPQVAIQLDGPDGKSARTENGSVAALRDSSLSVSAVHGKSFVMDGREYGHVIDPRSGEPVGHTLLAAVTGPSPTVSDALSTALLVLGKRGLSELADAFPGYAGFVIPRGGTR